MMRRPRSPAWGLAGWLALSFGAAALGGIASASAGAFYTQLSRPLWAPPAWLFGPVWTVLYVMMAIAAWLVWREEGWSGAQSALALYVIQLSCNALWTWLFFTWRQGEAALVDMVALLLLILATMLAFARVRSIAGLLLVPYLFWVAFATALTASLWMRNPNLL